MTVKYLDPSRNFTATIYATNYFLSNSFMTTFLQRSNTTDAKFWDKKLKIQWVNKRYVNQELILTKKQFRFGILWDSANISFTCSANLLKTGPWQIAYVWKWCDQNYKFYNFSYLVIFDRYNYEQIFSVSWIR